MPARQNSAERTSKAGVSEKIRETHGVRKKQCENFVEKKREEEEEEKRKGKCEKGEINSLEENFKGRLEMVGSGGGDKVRAVDGQWWDAGPFWDEI